MRHRPGYSLIELLVVIAIIGVLVGLLVPAVQKVREGAHMVTCSNQLHQLGVGLHHSHDAFRKMPPGIGWYPGTTGPGAYGTVMFHLLPFVEQSALYQSSHVGGDYFAGNNNVFATPVPLYVCPSDPSARTGVVADQQGISWGACSYAVNAQVFTTTSSTGVMISPQHYARLPQSFPDGTAQTILMAEKYALCTNNSYRAGGNLWAYWLTSGTVRPYHPGFAVSWNGYSIGPGSRFQIMPAPHTGNCDPTVASSPHHGGIHVTMADGSVRFLSASITPYTWWYLCTPAGGETIQDDF